jgi:alcohol dehydrogenase
MPDASIGGMSLLVSAADSAIPFEVRTRTMVIFGDGALARVGSVGKELGFVRSLLVADAGVVQAGIAGRAADALEAVGIRVVRFSDFASNPDTRMVEAGASFAAAHRVDSLIGLGGGSSMDCAKGINFVLTQGGRMADYRGFGKAAKPMLPAIGIPTTAGTGSEAQSYAIISDADTHEKLACGDPKAAFSAVILDPGLTRSQPRAVTATAGFDAISHAVETFVTTRRNSFSEMLSREAWRLLEPNYEHVLTAPVGLEARAAMQLGAHYAGMAIELSMLGATHACANPLTARYGTTHGVAIAVMLPHVVRWNGSVVRSRYADLLRPTERLASNENPEEVLAGRLEELARMGGLPRDLRALGVARADLQTVAQEAATQWTGRFNPRPFDAAAALEIYQCAW